ncbi:MAG: RagB/SusD family nutrient uptake outer membrane protein [Gemmatimonadota bacterium]
MKIFQRNGSKREESVLPNANRVLAVALVPLFMFSVAACGDIFEVENPTNILDEELDDAGLATALGNTPEAAVASPFGESVAWSATTSDEGYVAGSGSFRIQLEEGFFSSENDLSAPIYDNLASARWIADDALRRLMDLVDNPNSDIRVARAHFWGGVARITLADHFEDVVYDGNPPIEPREAIEDAVAKFEEASQIAQSAGDAALAAAAMGAVARGYRSLYFEEMHHGAGENPSLFQQAATAAEQALSMDSNFIEYANYALPGSQNPVWNHLGAGPGSRYIRLDPKFGNLEDPVSGERDPRIIHGESRGPSARTGEPVFILEKYLSSGSDIPVSRADEARLIIAEYELMFGDQQKAVEMINAVRAGVNLPAFSSTDEQEITEQLRYERFAEFWFEGRHWQDMRYYEVIPQRWADANKSLGVHRRWPVSVTERDNNPAYR